MTRSNMQEQKFLGSCVLTVSCDIQSNIMYILLVEGSLWLAVYFSEVWVSGLVKDWPWEEPRPHKAQIQSEHGRATSL